MNAFSPARRGDLVVIESEDRSFVIGGPSTVTTRFDVAEVTNIFRDGRIKNVRHLDSDSASYPQPLDRWIGHKRHWLVRAADLDMPAALAELREHTWPNSTLIRPFDSLAEVTGLLRTYRRAAGNSVVAA